jgi:FkbM family methyltransferase
MNPFGNDDPLRNGELWFFEHLRQHPALQVIFDVGCRADTLFGSFEGDVHYFEPQPSVLAQLAAQPHAHRGAWFNAFGLGAQNTVLNYYPRYQSFINRTTSCRHNDAGNSIPLQIRKAREYLDEHRLDRVDFVKIDTEGYELEVLRGFEDALSRVGIVQFEYGGTYRDSGVHLRDVVRHLRDHGFERFSYLHGRGLCPVDEDPVDHYRYCNVVAVRRGSGFESLLSYT